MNELTAEEVAIIYVDVLQIVCLIFAGFVIVLIRSRFIDRHLWLSLCALIVLFVMRRVDDISELLNRPLFDPLLTVVFSSAVVILFMTSVLLVYRSERQRRLFRVSKEKQIEQLEALKTWSS